MTRICGDRFESSTPIDGRVMAMPGKRHPRWSLSAGSDGGVGADGYIGGGSRVLCDPGEKSCVVHGRYKIDNLAGSPPDAPGIVFRWVDSSNYCYAIAYHGPADNQWVVRQVDGGVDSPIGAGGFTPSTAGFDVDGYYDLWISVQGITITVWTAAAGPLTLGGRRVHILTTSSMTNFATFKDATTVGLNSPSTSSVEYRLFEVLTLFGVQDR